MKSRLVFAFFAFIFARPIFAQLNLGQCIMAAEKNMPQAQLLPLVKQSEVLQINALNKNLLPQASLGGQATWQSAVTGLNLRLPGIEMQPIPKDQYKATLDLSQTLWDGGQLKSQKYLAIANSNAEAKSIETNIYQIREQVANLYFGAILAEKQIELAEIAKNDLQNNLKRFNANVLNGTAIKSTVLAFEAKLLEVSQLQREFKSRKLAALQGLAILTGLEITEKNQLEYNLESPNTNALAINRPEIKMFEAQKNVAEANKAVVDSKYMPRLNLFGTGGYGRPGLNFLSPDFSTYFIGGVSLKIPISQWYTHSKSIDYQLIDLNKLKIEKQKLQFLQQVNLKLNTLNEDASKLADLIEDDKKLIEIRSQMKKTAQNRLENGVITTSEYLTELDSEASAKQNMILHQIQLLQVKFIQSITAGNY